MRSDDHFVGFFFPAGSVIICNPYNNLRISKNGCGPDIIPLVTFPGYSQSAKKTSLRLIENFGMN